MTVKPWLKQVSLLSIVVLDCWGCSNFRSPAAPSDDYNPKPVLTAPFTVADVILATNRWRVANGLKPLAENSKLNLAADFKMRDMFMRQYFDHYGPGQTSGLPELLTRFGYRHMSSGENLARGNFKNADELLTGWMARPGHRANILDNRFTDIGVGIGYDVFEGKRTIFVVQIFGNQSRQ